ncbi:MAG: TIGR00282 family metallophosphoesterase, partial [Dehalococcoidia bacterium]|nr:TIGR00282 family metallophosphoesterase [Dehalococcoidia bacterium]
GRRAVRMLAPQLRKEHHIDFIIANGENAAGGFGITLENMQEFLECGVDVVTTGNHVWDQKDIVQHMDGELPIVRPYNYPPGVPGRGYIQKNGVLVINLMGRTFMADIDCPFRAADRILADVNPKPSVVIVDFHGEATSEKQAMGWYLDGRVGAVVGTHTHVGTVDARVLPGGTAFVTDIGMVGPRDSVIGVDVQGVLHRFLTQMPARFEVAKGPVTFNSVLIETDDGTGRARSIQRLDRGVE